MHILSQERPIVLLLSMNIWETSIRRGDEEKLFPLAMTKN